MLLLLLLLLLLLHRRSTQDRPFIGRLRIRVNSPYLLVSSINIINIEKQVYVTRTPFKYYFLKNIGIIHVVSCSKIFRGSRKLFESEAVRVRIASDTANVNALI